MRYISILGSMDRHRRWSKASEVIFNLERSGHTVDWLYLEGDFASKNLRNKSAWHNWIKYCPNNFSNLAINLSCSPWLAFNIAPSRIWFGCNIRQNLIGKISVELLNIISWMCMFRNCQRKLYNYNGTEWWWWYLIRWVPVRYSRRLPFFKL